MKPNLVRFSAALTAAIAPAAAIAHPGHGTAPASSWLHLVEAPHLALVLGALATGALLYRAWARR